MLFLGGHFDPGSPGHFQPDLHGHFDPDLPGHFKPFSGGHFDPASSGHFHRFFQIDLASSLLPFTYPRFTSHLSGSISLLMVI